MKRPALYFSFAFISMIAGSQFSNAQNSSTPADDQIVHNPEASSIETNNSELPATANQSITTAEPSATDVNTDDLAHATVESTGQGIENSEITYLCTHGEQQRRIEVDLLEPPQAVPCEVNYYKDTEEPGTKTTLWTANNDSYYCENRAQGLIQTLEDANWSCTAN